MPSAYIKYTDYEAADIIRRDAQERTGQVILASKVKRVEGGWMVPIDIPKKDAQEGIEIS